MDVNVTIDWLRYSSPNGYQLINMIPPEMEIDYTEQLSPLPHYTQAYKLIPSGRVDTNTIRTEQGSLATFGGGDLRVLSDNGINPYYLAAYTAEKKFLHCSRMDLAIDLMYANYDPTDIVIAWREKRVKTHARDINQIIGYDKETSRTGNTVYVGSRTSETYLRVYDKGLEQGSDVLWTRIELELKKGKAKLAHQATINNSVSTIMSSALDTYVQIECLGWWEEMRENLPSATDVMKGERRQKQETDSKWLYDVALVKVCNAIKNGDEKARDAVLKALIWYGNSQPIDKDLF